MKRSYLGFRGGGRMLFYTESSLRRKDKKIFESSDGVSLGRKVLQTEGEQRKNPIGTCLVCLRN